MERQFRPVPRIVDLTSFGGTVRRYEVQPDPDRLRRYGVTLAQLQTALTNSNFDRGRRLRQPGPGRPDRTRRGTVRRRRGPGQQGARAGDEVLADCRQERSRTGSGPRQNRGRQAEGTDLGGPGAGLKVDPPLTEQEARLRPHHRTARGRLGGEGCRLPPLAEKDIDARGARSVAERRADAAAAANGHGLEEQPAARAAETGPAADRRGTQANFRDPAAGRTPPPPYSAGKNIAASRISAAW